MKVAMDAGYKLGSEGKEFGEVGRPAWRSGDHRGGMGDLRQVQAPGLGSKRERRLLQ
jgi:hypothetical protein